MKQLLLILLLLFSLFLFADDEHHNNTPKKALTGDICAGYITGIGCPNCAKTDPMLLQTRVEKYPRLSIFEYEVYKLKKENRETVLAYFSSFFPDEGSAIPCLILDREITAIGKWDVFALEEELVDFSAIPFSFADGEKEVEFKDLDITTLPGAVKIWHKNRVLLWGEGGKSDDLKKALTAESIEDALKKIAHTKIKPFGVEVSKATIPFDNAVKIGEWTLLWRNKKKIETDVVSAPVVKVVQRNNSSISPMSLIMLALITLFFGLYLFDRHNMIKLGTLSALSERQKNMLVVFGALIFVVGFFSFAKGVSPQFLKEMGYTLPLPVFTLMIALVDGFNPCNMFVLTFLLALMVSVSHSRTRIYVVGYTFVIVVFIIYSLFMVAWLNIFKYIGFIDPLRITIAVIALIAGLINCKELIFFKKGISLTTSEKGANFLQKKARKMKDTIKNGTMPMLVMSSVVLAFFASMIELPCTAGFPIVYTSILSGMEIASGSMSYYFWIMLYNLFYVIPLAVIITVFGYTFRGKAISEKTVQKIKFIGGFIMILLGIILLVNPGMIGIGM